MKSFNQEFLIRMRFTMRDNHLSANSLVVKCNANIGEAYWQTTDAVIQVIGKPSYMSHSRSNSYSGNLSRTYLLFAISI